MLNKPALYAKHGWLKADAAPLNVIIGDDLDAALSAVLFLYKHPNARVIGVYSKYQTVYYSTAHTWADVLDAVWLDLDIVHPRCRSLGHHIVRADARDALAGFHNSLNLNDLQRKTLQRNFDEKYPLGIVHFLMWLYAQEIPNVPDADLLLWLADSAYINAQARAFRKRWQNGKSQWTERAGFKWNVKSWLYGVIQIKSLQKTFEQVDTLGFEERMQAFQAKLDVAGFGQGDGQVASHHLKLSGYQCQPVGEVGTFMVRLLNFCAAQTGWTFAPQQIEIMEPLQAQTGTRATEKLERVNAQGLAAFLQAENVFSYVFTRFDTINFTTFDTV